jgi:hypothetical protein
LDCAEFGSGAEIAAGRARHQAGGHSYRLPARLRGKTVVVAMLSAPTEVPVACSQWNTRRRSRRPCGRRRAFGVRFCFVRLQGEKFHRMALKECGETVDISGGSVGEQVPLTAFADALRLLYLRTLTHELGHILGLYHLETSSRGEKHPLLDDRKELMWRTNGGFDPGSEQLRPSIRTRAALRWLYGQSDRQPNLEKGFPGLCRRCFAPMWLEMAHVSARGNTSSGGDDDDDAGEPASSGSSEG